MAAKLLAMNVCDRLVLWIVDFLVLCTQSVRYQTAVSSSRSISAGSPQGTVLSPVLFTFYTNDCKLGNDTTLLIKYSDDSAIEDLSNSDTTYSQEVERFDHDLVCSEENHLDLNAGKTKEMEIDFRKSSPVVRDLIINDVKVESVTEYKYLGTVLLDCLLDYLLACLIACLFG